MSKIIAIIGMPGSGKTEAVTYLEKKYQWPKIYFGQVTIDEVKRRGLEVTPNNERVVRESLRNEFGESHYAQEMIKRIEAMAEHPVILVESLYSWPEYQMFKATFGPDFQTIAIHASPKTRHERLAVREHRPLTKGEALERDIAQLNRFEQGSPIALADFMVVNEGDMTKLTESLDRIVEQLSL